MNDVKFISSFVAISALLLENIPREEGKEFPTFWYIVCCIVFFTASYYIKSLIKDKK